MMWDRALAYLLHDVLECLYVSHSVMHGIVVVRRLPKAFPRLRLAPVPLQTSPEVADTSGGMAKWILQTRSVEGSIDPLVVIGGVIADEDRAIFAQFLQPTHEIVHDLFQRRD